MLPAHLEAASGQPAQRLFDKIWDAHVVLERADGMALLHVDRHVLHELGSFSAFVNMEKNGRSLHSPDLLIATQDRMVSTASGRTDGTYAPGLPFQKAIRANARRHGFNLIPLNDPRQGIVHVMAPEQGIALPGCLLACGDSHTCTNGGVGALAIGMGIAEIEHVLATQTIALARPKALRVVLQGLPGKGASAKDLVLRVLATIGIRGGVGHAIEFAGRAVSALGVEGRLTLCNMSIECGARIGMVAPDDTTYQWIAGRPFAPRGALWDRALESWRCLPSDADAVFDEEIIVDVGGLAPQITWGTLPDQVVPVDSVVPFPEAIADAKLRDAAIRALEYMGVTPGQRLEDLAVDYAFIGSCTNGRLEDLRAAAAVLRGRRVATHVRALAVPGSTLVKRQAEAEGLDKVFLSAGFAWRESGCSMCAGVNDDRVESGKRSISTTNRNFEGRQGPGVRTHLASPQTVAASAVMGRIADVRKLEGVIA